MSVVTREQTGTLEAVWRLWTEVMWGSAGQELFPFVG